MNNHNHTECSHDLKDCLKCDVVECTKCKKEWKMPILNYGANGGNGSGGGSLIGGFMS